MKKDGLRCPIRTTDANTVRLQYHGCDLSKARVNTSWTADIVCRRRLDMIGRGVSLAVDFALPAPPLTPSPPSSLPDEGPRTPRRNVSMASLSMSRTSSEVDFVGRGTVLNEAGLLGALTKRAGLSAAAGDGDMDVSPKRRRRVTMSLVAVATVLTAVTAVVLLKRRR